MYDDPMTLSAIGRVRDLIATATVHDDHVRLRVDSERDSAFWLEIRLDIAQLDTLYWRLQSAAAREARKFLENNPG